MKIEEIERLIEIVAKSEIDSLELKAGGVEVRIRKERRAAGPPAPPARTSESAAPRSAAAARSAPPPQPVEEEAGLHVVRASMVGTFFRSPSPGAPPFVEAGDTVRKGQVLCIIEAMKLMNELESDATGRIVKVYVEDGQPVEFGESLFAVQPASP